MSEYQQLVAVSLAEDLDERGDLTASTTVDEGTTAVAQVVARQHGVVAGIQAAVAVFDAVDDALDVEAHLADGARVSPGDTALAVSGAARSILTAERTALNLATHASGIATLTAAYVAAVDGTGAAIRDTRKTIPGLRMLEKEAVAAGGGQNHRMSLSDGILIKDNHVVAAGGIGAAVRRAIEADTGAEVQAEVDDLGELDEALAAGARSVLLDNFAVDTMREAVRRCRAHDSAVYVEASGGVNLDTVRAIAETGVDAIAVGALTHSAPALDLAMDFAPEPPRVRA